MIRSAVPAELDRLYQVDHLALAGDPVRRAEIERWVGLGAARVVEVDGLVEGYCVVEESFFGHPFVAMLLIAAAARGRRLGDLLLRDAVERYAGRKIFTSTNLSNQAMQRLLTRSGWQSVGILYGLDEGDPELFYVRSPSSATVQM